MKNIFDISGKRILIAGGARGIGFSLARMLAEHGSLGIVALLILFFLPLIFHIENKQNIFMFCFFMFWLLTINHAAMRTASTSFIYALALLNIRFDEK